MIVNSGGVPYAAAYNFLVSQLCKRGNVGHAMQLVWENGGSWVYLLLTWLIELVRGSWVYICLTYVTPRFDIIYKIVNRHINSKIGKEIGKASVVKVIHRHTP